MNPRRLDRLIVVASVLVSAIVIILGQLAARGEWLLPRSSLCASQLLLGRDCPGCGITRSLISLGAGSLPHALAYNPLGPFLFGCMLLQLLVRSARLAGAEMRWLGTFDLGMVVVVTAVVIAHTLVFYFVG